MKHRITGQSFEVWDDTAQTWFVLCSAFGIEEVLVDTLTGKHQVTAFVDSTRSGRNTITFPRDNIRQKVVMKALYSIGLDTPDGDDDVAAIQGVLLEMEQEAPVKFFHDRLGYARIDGQKVYLLDKPVGIPAHKKSASEHVSQLVRERDELIRKQKETEKIRTRAAEIREVCKTLSLSDDLINELAKSSVDDRTLRVRVDRIKYYQMNYPELRIQPSQFITNDDIGQYVSRHAVSKRNEQVTCIGNCSTCRREECVLISRIED